MPESSTAPVPSAAGFPADIWDDRAQGRSRRRMEQLADLVWLPPSHEGVPDAAAWLPSVGEVVQICTGLEYADDRRVATVSAIPDRASAVRIRDELRSRGARAWDQWSELICMENLLKPDVLCPSTVGLTVRRLGRRKAEGIINASRSVGLSGWDRGVSAKYGLDLHFVYVAPDARGVGLAPHLTAGLIEQMYRDIVHLKPVMASVGRKARFKAGIYAETESIGGLRVAECLADAMERIVLNVFGERVELEHEIG